MWCKLSFAQKFRSTLPACVAENWLSVVVVCRNEISNLPNLVSDLQNQTLAKQYWEAIFVDDASEDGSYQWLLAESRKVDFRLKVLQNSLSSHILSPKKRGITAAIQEAEGVWIACTDADCRLPRTWLEKIFEASQNPDSSFISMPVKFSPTHSCFEQWQAVEFASLIGSGAACIALGLPTMCNGANIAYRKEVFEQVGGFSGSEHIASGDDEFLMHKIAKQSAKGIQFVKSPQTTVATPANTTWRAFFSQRLRWASKWEQYQNWFAKILAVFVFLVNICTIFLYIYQDFWTIVFKFSVEFIFLGLILHFLGQALLIAWIPFVFVFYPFYVVFFALFARKKEFSWKERAYKHTAQ
ncbi:MAG: glycosyltransferase [Raineya sp.]